MGHRALGSNAWHFMHRMGVNAARMFLYNTILCAPLPWDRGLPRAPEVLSSAQAGWGVGFLPPAWAVAPRTHLLGGLGFKIRVLFDVHCGAQYAMLASTW